MSETVEELKKALVVEQNAHNKTQKKLTGETEAHNATKDLLVAEKKSHEETSKSAIAEIDEVTKKLEAATKHKGTGKTIPTVSIDGKDYKVTINKFTWEGKEKTSDDVVADKALATELLAEGFGGLQLVSK